MRTKDYTTIQEENCTTLFRLEDGDKLVYQHSDLEKVKTWSRTITKDIIMLLRNDYLTDKDMAAITLYVRGITHSLSEGYEPQYTYNSKMRRSFNLTYELSKLVWKPNESEECIINILKNFGVFIEHIKRKFILFYEDGRACLCDEDNKDIDISTFGIDEWKSITKYICASSGDTDMIHSLIDDADIRVIVKHLMRKSHKRQTIFQSMCKTLDFLSLTRLEFMKKYNVGRKMYNTYVKRYDELSRSIPA